MEFKSTALTLGAIMSIVIMTGAIFFHLFTPLGIIMPHFNASTGQQIGNDSGVLFIMACLTWASAVALALIELKNPNSCISQFVTNFNHKKP